MSSGSLIGFGLLFLVIGIIIALLAPVVDTLNTVNDQQIASGAPYSQDRADTLLLLEYAFGSIGAVVLFAGGINLWVNSVREQSQDV